MQATADDEPIFVLVARDALAPAAVRMWIDMANLVGVPKSKIDEAEELLVKMRRWGEEHGTKTPD